MVDAENTSVSPTSSTFATSTFAPIQTHTNNVDWLTTSNTDGSQTTSTQRDTRLSWEQGDNTINVPWTSEVLSSDNSDSEHHLLEKRKGFKFGKGGGKGGKGGKSKKSLENLINDLKKKFGSTGSSEDSDFCSHDDIKEIANASEKFSCVPLLSEEEVRRLCGTKEGRQSIIIALDTCFKRKDNVGSTNSLGVGSVAIAVGVIAGAALG